MKKQKNEQVTFSEYDSQGVPLEAKLGTVITKETIRPDGSRRIQQDFSLCPTMTEQHTAHLTDINYLMEKYKPDELQAFLAARQQYRTEVLGHDFSTEPNLQEAKNIVYQSNQAFLQLPDEVRSQFQNHLEFLKFIDNPSNVEKMLKLGILTPRQVTDLQIPQNPLIPTTPLTPTTPNSTTNPPSPS